MPSLSPLSSLASDVIVYIFGHYHTKLPVENIAIYTNKVQKLKELVNLSSLRFQFICFIT